MSNQHRSTFAIAAFIGFVIVFLIPVMGLSASPLGPAPTEPLVTTSVITLTDTDDVDATQRGDHNATYPNSYLVLSKDAQGNYDNNFVLFDLSALPANAAINSAVLHVNVPLFNGSPLDVELARVDSAWDETTVSWNTQPTFTLGGPVATISGTGDLSWTLTSLAQAWQNGTLPNYGVMFRGTNSTGAAVIADSKEAGWTTDPIVPPSLVIEYSYPTPTGARPDLGDAPDSTNHVGITNTAYPGIQGNFPTVWAGTPITQAAGPRHANLTGEGILGNFLTRENEADIGPDEDVLNNILNGGADNSNNDRADDGWLNRNVGFPDCEQTTLRVRVSKALTATLNKMYLNVWFDGNRDGDWNDDAPCLPQGEQLRIPSTEWIVQDYIVDMASIAPGGFADIAIDTETVFNTSPHQAHWLRFTLSEVRAVQSASGRADGRGPNPNAEYGTYHFGETEDYVQRPQPPGDIGALQLHKTVGGNGFPTEWIDYVTYKVNLRHDGGSQPVEAELQDVLPYPLIVYPTVDSSGVRFITVDSEGGVSPLSAAIAIVPGSGSTPPEQAVRWRGTLDPNSEITLTFKVRVLSLCSSNQPTQTIQNIAQARPVTSTTNITASVSFSAKCLGYTGNDTDVHWVDPISHTLPITAVLQWSDYRGGGSEDKAAETEARHGETEAMTEAFVGHPFPVTMTFNITRVLTTTLPGWEIILPPHAERVTLPPSQTQLLDYGLDFTDLVTDELNLTGDFTAVQTLNFCILPGPDANQCPNPQLFPGLFGHSTPLTITVKPHDLGDAPDSTNHAGTALTAYPGVQANYPTVYDPAFGLPIGPLHRHPLPFHLGQNVSREAEADLGPDQDPLNNIEPAANDANNDRFDDGINPGTWSLANCQTRVMPVRVFISLQAVNWFQQQNKPAYINLWLDANRDGDWADGFTCPPDRAAVEHIVIDRAINVVALGAGLHTINVTTGLIPWPAALAQQPAWVRVMLSDFPSNKPFNFGGINYGDGRGYATPFQTGETEDYFAYPDGTIGGGPDVAVDLDGTVKFATASQIEALAPTAITSTDQIRFKIEYNNVGSRPATGALLTFTVPTQLQGVPPTIIQAPGISPADIHQANNQISFLLPHMQQDDARQIVVGWATTINVLAHYTATARVDINGDLDLSNNQATATITPTQPAPIIGILIGLNHIVWGGVDTTSRDRLNLAGVGTPGQTVEVLVDGDPVGNTLIEPDGIFYFQLTNLTSGHHRLGARYGGAAHIVAPRDVATGQAAGLISVDPTLPFDPLSLTFTDSQGHTYHPPTLGFSWGVSRGGVSFKAGETYEVGVDSTSNVPNQRFALMDGTSNTILVGLRDDDGDGRYTGRFVYNPIALHGPTAADAVSELRIDVTNGGIEQSYSLDAQPLTSGIVRDAITQQPIANASLALLGAQLQAGFGTIFNAWPTEALGQPNPQTTGVDGAYDFNTPGGLNRVDVIRSGYQPYRSFDLVAANGVIAQDIDLTPDITGTAAITVLVTANGFEPAVVNITPGSVVEWVNVDLAEHTTKSAAWNSGVLGAGQSYKFKLTPAGTYAYGDDTNAQTTGVIVVAGNRLYLPLVRR